MQLVFLGHQSWLASFEDCHVLIDPILKDRFGSDDGIEIFPPRLIDVGAMPRLSAIFLSHEHSDHFHLPSIHALSRDAEIFVGTNMVQAAEDALRSLGFSVRRQQTGQAFQIGSITATFYAASQETAFWESRVNQFMLRPTTRPRDSVFIAVDAMISREYIADLTSGAVEKPTVVAVSNNSQITPPGVFGSLDNLIDLRGANAKKGLHGLKILNSLLGTYLEEIGTLPDILICGNGFMKGYEELGPFPFSDQKVLAQSARTLSKRNFVHGPYPGERYTIGESGGITSDLAPFVLVDHPRLDLLRQRSKAFIDGGRSIEMQCISKNTPRNQAVKARQHQAITSELRRMVLPIMLSRWGQAAVELKAYLSGPLGPQRILFQCLDDNSKPEHQWALDVVRAEFVPVDLASETENVFAHFPFGIIVHTCDLHAVIKGDLQIWDIAGLALRSWYIGSPENSPVSFLYAWFGEQLSPALASNQYRAKVEALGFAWHSASSTHQLEAIQ